MGDREESRPGPGLGYTVAFAAVAVLVAMLALRAGGPPEPLPKSAAEDLFSANRAMAHVEALTRAPRPVGSAAHESARAYLEAELKRLGLETQIQETTWVRGFGRGRQTAARVRNVLARLPGQGGDTAGDALLLMAHYDSQPQTLGAGDDAAGVATILEVLRARSADGPPRNEILVALTDAEEVGLIGADAFAGAHPWFDRVDRTLNFEGRGQRGAVLMFETAEGGLSSARDLARHAPYPAASSMSYEVYRRMPNDTDFSVVKRAGGHGLNFAFIEGLPAYHSMLDTAERLDRGTLQHMGSNALALTRHYASIELEPPVAAEGVYFNLWGSRFLVVLPEVAARGAALAAIALALAGFLGLRARGEASVARVVIVWGLVVVGGALAVAEIWVAQRLVGTLPATPYGVPYSEGAAALGLVFVALSAWSLALVLCRSRAWELLAALALLWGLLGVASAWAVVGLSHLVVVPALGLGLAVALAPWLRRAWWVLLVAMVPGILLWAPAIDLSYRALTINAAVPLAALCLFATTLLTPAFAWLAPRDKKRVAVLALVSGLSLLGWAIFGQEPSPDRPRVDSLFVFHDPQGGDAWWYSLDPRIDAWNRQALGAAPERRPLPEVLDPSRRERLAAPASTPPPEQFLEVVRERDERPGGGRSVAIRLRSSAESLRLWVHANVVLSSVSIDGRPCELDENGELRLSVHGRSPDGFLLQIEMDDRWPVYLDVVEVSYGLPTDIDERPADRIPRPGWWTDTTMVHTSLTL